jgi:hypothetical protein
MSDERPIDAIRGKTIRLTFTDCALAGATREQTFNEDGTVSWRWLEGPEQGRSGNEPRYGAVRVADEAYATSYLSGDGVTMTIALNFEDHRFVGFRSNERQWDLLRGSFEVAKTAAQS